MQAERNKLAKELEAAAAMQEAHAAAKGLGDQVLAITQPHM